MQVSIPFDGVAKGGPLLTESRSLLHLNFIVDIDYIDYVVSEGFQTSPIGFFYSCIVDNFKKT